MAECEVVSDYLQGSETLSPSIVPPPLVDGGYIIDRVRLFLGVTLTDSGSLIELMQPNSAAYVLDAAAGSQLLELAGTFLTNVADAGRISDSARLTFKELLNDTGALSESLVLSAQLNLLQDVGHIADSVGAFEIGSNLFESGRFADALRSVKGALLVDAGALGESVLPTVPFSLNLLDAGVLGDTVEQIARVQALLADAGQITDGLVQIATLAATLNDDASIYDFYHLAGTGGAWTAPTDTFAMSRWDSIGFNSIAEIDGELYAAADDGLYRLTPNAGNVDARIRGGLSDFADDSLKHASYFYVGYSSPGQLRVTVGYIPNGVEESVAYELPSRAAGLPTPNRTKLGRGMRSRYWRVTLENVNGAPFALYDQRLLLEGSSRRV